MNMSADADRQIPAYAGMTGVGCENDGREIHDMEAIRRDMGHEYVGGRRPTDSRLCGNDGGGLRE